MNTALLAGTRILVVEDEPMIALDLEQTLLAAGAAVSIATSVQDALALIGTEPFSAAIVDHGLRQEKGREVYDHLEAHNVPFLVYTGYSEVTGRPNQALIRKPADAATLVGAVRDLLGSTA